MKSIWMTTFFIVCAALTADAASIITGSGVRLRQSPTAAAQEITRLAFGTLAQEQERSARQETIAGKQNYWYRIRLEDGKQGWVFGAFLQPFEPSQKETIYRDLIRTRLQESLKMGDLVEVCLFLNRAIAETAAPDIKAELELARLIALNQSAQQGQAENAPQLEAWVAEQKADVEFHKLGAFWFVPAARFWKLHAAYAALPIADDIAWQAANAPTQGECEGFLPCHATRLNQTIGQYAERYPAGKHADEALALISQEMAGFAQQPAESYDRNAYLMLQGSLNRLRKTVENCGSPDKEAVMKILDEVQARHLGKK